MKKRLLYYACHKVHVISSGPKGSVNDLNTIRGFHSNAIEPEDRPRRHMAQTGGQCFGTAPTSQFAPTLDPVL